MTAREFNQSVARAQRVADDQPVMITRRGEPAYVLLSVGEYQRLAPSVPPEESRSILEIIEPLPDGADPHDLFGRIMDDIIADRKNDVGRPPIEL